MILTAAFALLALQDSATLLPETPAGWRFERLEFPLTFAPDLEYAGLEELSFAPGMFDPESDMYFSYVLDIELEGDHDLEETRFKAFLESYYRGLCEAVGEDRDPPLDLSNFAVDVRRDGVGYAATIQMVDAFVTGKAMTLELELSTWSGPNKTEFFGLASPMPKDAAVWKTMRAIRDRWEAARTLPVLLDYSSVQVDRETFDAIANSQVCKDLFGCFSMRGSEDSLLAEFYGVRTGLVILSDGLTRVAFEVERKGSLESLAQALTDAGLKNSYFEIGAGGALVMGNRGEPSDDQLSLVVGERPAPFLRRDGITTKAASLGQAEAHAAALVQDVSEVFLDLNAADAEYFAAVTKVFGYETNEGPGGVVYIGPQVRFVVNVSQGASRVTGFRLSLRRPVEEKQKITLGKATLTLQGKAATFYYQP